MSRCEMDVGGGGIDPVVTHQRLQHREVHPGLGQGGAERYLPWIRSIAWSEGIFGVEAREEREARGE